MGRDIPQSGKGTVSYSLIKNGYLTKESLRKLNGLAGNELHKGSMKAILRSNAVDIEAKKIWNWAKQITTLLSAHQIRLIGNGFFFCSMKNISYNNRVTVFFRGPSNRSRPIVADAPS